MNKRVTVKARWSGPIPERNGKPLPENRWARAGRKRSWTVRWYAPDGSRPRQTFETKEDAEAFARAKSAQFESRGPQARVRPERVTLGQFAAEFETLRIGPRGQRLSIGTVRAYRPPLRRFVKTIGPHVLLADVTPADVVRFMAGLRKSDYSLATVNKYRAALTAILNTAVVQLAYLQLNPCRNVKADKLPDQDKRYVDAGEFQKIIATCDTRGDRALWWRTFITLSYTSATRANETTHVAWHDVDFDGDSVRIVAKPDAGDLEAWQPKDHDARTIPLPPVTMDLLSRLHAEATQRARYVFLSPLREAWIKAKRDAGQWREGADVVNNLGRDFKRIVKAAGVSDVCLHDLRRSCITNWARKLPTPVVKELAGHADIKTTLQYYITVTASDLAAARDITAEAIASRPKVDPNVL